VWRLLVSFAASVLGAVLLLRAPTDLPRTYLPVPLIPLVTAQAPLIAIPKMTPPPLAGGELGGGVIEPDWNDASAVALAKPHPPRRRPTQIARAAPRRSLDAHAPPALSPIGRVFAWLSAHAVHNAIGNDMVAGG